MVEGAAVPPEDKRPRVRWWPTKYRVRVGRNLSDQTDQQYAMFTGDAWWQWRQRLRTKSIRNLERWYLQPFIFGRDDR
jgi:hypothetical protein